MQKAGLASSSLRLELSLPSTGQTCMLGEGANIVGVVDRLWTMEGAAASGAGEGQHRAVAGGAFVLGWAR